MCYTSISAEYDGQTKKWFWCAAGGLSKASFGTGRVATVMSRFRTGVFRGPAVKTTVARLSLWKIGSTCASLEPHCISSWYLSSRES